MPTFIPTITETRLSLSTQIATKYRTNSSSAFTTLKDIVNISLDTFTDNVPITIMPATTEFYENAFYLSTQVDDKNIVNFTNVTSITEIRSRLSTLLISEDIGISIIASNLIPFKFTKIAVTANQISSTFETTLTESKLISKLLRESVTTVAFIQNSSSNNSFYSKNISVSTPFVYSYVVTTMNNVPVINNLTTDNDLIYTFKEVTSPYISTHGINSDEIFLSSNNFITTLTSVPVTLNTTLLLSSAEIFSTSANILKTNPKTFILSSILSTISSMKNIMKTTVDQTSTFRNTTVSINTAYTTNFIHDAPSNAQIITSNKITITNTTMEFEANSSNTTLITSSATILHRTTISAKITTYPVTFDTTFFINTIVVPTIIIATSQTIMTTNNSTVTLLTTTNVIHTFNTVMITTTAPFLWSNLLSSIATKNNSKDFFSLKAITTNKTMIPNNSTSSLFNHLTSFLSTKSNVNDDAFHTSNVNLTYDTYLSSNATKSTTTYFNPNNTLISTDITSLYYSQTTKDNISKTRTNVVITSLNFITSSNINSILLNTSYSLSTSTMSTTQFRFTTEPPFMNNISTNSFSNIIFTSKTITNRTINNYSFFNITTRNSTAIIINTTNKAYFPEQTNVVGITSIDINTSFSTSFITTSFSMFIFNSATISQEVQSRENIYYGNASNSISLLDTKSTTNIHDTNATTNDELKQVYLTTINTTPVSVTITSASISNIVSDFTTKINGNLTYFQTSYFSESISNSPMHQFIYKSVDTNSTVLNSVEIDTIITDAFTIQQNNKMKTNNISMTSYSESVNRINTIEYDVSSISTLPIASTTEPITYTASDNNSVSTIINILTSTTNRKNFASSYLSNDFLTNNIMKTSTNSQIVSNSKTTFANKYTRLIDNVDKTNKKTMEDINKFSTTTTTAINYITTTTALYVISLDHTNISSTNIDNTISADIHNTYNSVISITTTYLIDSISFITTTKKFPIVITPESSIEVPINIKISTATPFSNILYTTSTIQSNFIVSEKYFNNYYFSTTMSFITNDFFKTKKNHNNNMSQFSKKNTNTFPTVFKSISNNDMNSDYSRLTTDVSYTSHSTTMPLPIKIRTSILDTTYNYISNLSTASLSQNNKFIITSNYSNYPSRVSGFTSNNYNETYATKNITYLVTLLILLTTIQPGISSIHNLKQNVTISMQSPITIRTSLLSTSYSTMTNTPSTSYSQNDYSIFTSYYDNYLGNVSGFTDNNYNVTNLKQNMTYLTTLLIPLTTIEPTISSIHNLNQNISFNKNIGNSTSLTLNIIRNSIENTIIPIVDEFSTLSSLITSPINFTENISESNSDFSILDPTNTYDYSEASSYTSTFVKPISSTQVTTIVGTSIKQTSDILKTTLNSNISSFIEVNLTESTLILTNSSLTNIPLTTIVPIFTTINVIAVSTNSTFSSLFSLDISTTSTISKIITNLSNTIITTLLTNATSYSTYDYSTYSHNTSNLYFNTTTNKTKKYSTKTIITTLNQITTLLTTLTYTTYSLTELSLTDFTTSYPLDKLSYVTSIIKLTKASLINTNINTNIINSTILPISELNTVYNSSITLTNKITLLTSPSSTSSNNSSFLLSKDSITFNSSVTLYKPTAVYFTVSNSTINITSDYYKLYNTSFYITSDNKAQNTELMNSSFSKMIFPTWLNITNITITNSFFNVTSEIENTYFHLTNITNFEELNSTFYTTIMTDAMFNISMDILTSTTDFSLFTNWSVVKYQIGFDAIFNYSLSNSSSDDYWNFSNKIFNAIDPVFKRYFGDIYVGIVNTTHGFKYFNGSIITNFLLNLKNQSLSACDQQLHNELSESLSNVSLKTLPSKYFICGDKECQYFCPKYDTIVLINGIEKGTLIGIICGVVGTFVLAVSVLATVIYRMHLSKIKAKKAEKFRRQQKIDLVSDMASTLYGRTKRCNSITFKPNLSITSINKEIFDSLNSNKDTLHRKPLNKLAKKNSLYRNNLANMTVAFAHQDNEDNASDHYRHDHAPEFLKIFKNQPLFYNAEDLRRDKQTFRNPELPDFTLKTRMNSGMSNEVDSFLGFHGEGIFGQRQESDISLSLISAKNELFRPFLSSHLNMNRLFSNGQNLGYTEYHLANSSNINNAFLNKNQITNYPEHNEHNRNYYQKEESKDYESTVSGNLNESYTDRLKINFDHDIGPRSILNKYSHNIIHPEIYRSNRLNHEHFERSYSFEDSIGIDSIDKSSKIYKKENIVFKDVKRRKSAFDEHSIFRKYSSAAESPCIESTHIDMNFEKQGKHNKRNSQSTISSANSAEVKSYFVQNKKMQFLRQDSIEEVNEDTNVNNIAMKVYYKNGNIKPEKKYHRSASIDDLESDNKASLFAIKRLKNLVSNLIKKFKS